MDPNFVQGLHNLLVQTSNGLDLKAATAQLNQDYYKNPSCISALASIIANSPEIAVRQLAAVEMRKRVSAKSGTLWTQLPENERHQIKEQFPGFCLNEANNLVRHAAARVVAAIASIEVIHGTWPELLPFVNQTCHAPQASHREVGIYILYAVLENAFEAFQKHLPAIFKLFEQTVVDPESIDVRITTVKALGSIAQYLDRDEHEVLAYFQNLLPAMIRVIAQCVETNNEAGARQLFDVLDTLLILEVPVLSKSIPELVQFLIQCGANRQFELELRILALNAMNWTVQYKKSKLNHLVLAPAILEGLMPITTEEEPEDVDDDSPSRSALRIIDCLCTHLPPTQVFPSLRTLILTYFSSPDPANRRGAMLALGISVEGCSEFITPLMDDIWPIIEAGLRDTDPSVRKAACIAVSCLCEWLEDECAAKHAVLVPMIMELINDPETQKSACTALDGLLEILHDVIDSYLPLIMERLGGLLDTAPLPVKAVITGAIGSAAHASKERFVPYFQPTMDRLQHFLVLTGEGEETELRGITMDAIGSFAESVGKDLFRPYFPDMMKQAFQGMELGSARLRECSFLFFGVMARVFGEEFAPYLPNVVPPLLNSCQQTEHGEDFDIDVASSAFSTSAGGSPSNAISVSEGDLESTMDGTELEDIDLDKWQDINSAIAVEKEIAADTIGALFAATGNHFFPYVEQSCIQLVTLLSHYYEGIRKSSLTSLLELVRTFYELGSYPEWTPGAVVTVPLNQATKDLINHVLPPLLEMFETEDHKSVVSSLCVGLADTINKIGPAFIEGQLEVICNMTIQILEQKAFCQQDPDQDEDEEAPEDQAEYDAVLISAAGDLVGALANVLGPDFGPAFNTFYPLIVKYCKKTRSTTDRASAIGCLAEIILGMKTAVTPHTETLYQLFYNCLSSDSETEVISNSAYGVGLLVEHSQVDMSGQYLSLLNVLRPLFDVPADSSSVKLSAKDNAAGAVARLILRNAAALPLDQVLPVFISSVPCNEDPMENRPVFRCVIYLITTQTSLMAPYMGGLLQVFAQVLDPSSPDRIGNEVRAELIQLIGQLNGQDPGSIQAAGLGVWV
ncbi:ARM repeat-containing protein [Mycena floridula]|nr:ARM repeat-containing protein [Mycena floridula]